jgi:hypothetical protein
MLSLANRGTSAFRQPPRSPDPPIGKAKNFTLPQAVIIVSIENNAFHEPPAFCFFQPIGNKSFFQQSWT